MDKKIYFDFEIRLTLIDLNQIFPMKHSQFVIFLSVESYAENFLNGYFAKNRIFYKLSNISFPNIGSAI